MKIMILLLVGFAASDSPSERNLADILSRKTFKKFSLSVLFDSLSSAFGKELTTNFEITLKENEEKGENVAEFPNKMITEDDMNYKNVVRTFKQKDTELFTLKVEESSSMIKIELKTPLIVTNMDLNIVTTDERVTPFVKEFITEGVFRFTSKLSQIFTNLSEIEADFKTLLEHNLGAEESEKVLEDKDPNKHGVILIQNGVQHTDLKYLPLKIEKMKNTDKYKDAMTAKATEVLESIGYTLTDSETNESFDVVIFRNKGNFFAIAASNYFQLEIDVNLLTKRHIIKSLEVLLAKVRFGLFPSLHLLESKAYTGNLIADSVEDVKSILGSLVKESETNKFVQGDDISSVYSISIAAEGENDVLVSFRFENKKKEGEEKEKAKENEKNEMVWQFSIPSASMYYVRVFIQNFLEEVRVFLISSIDSKNEDVAILPFIETPNTNPLTHKIVKLVKYKSGEKKLVDYELEESKITESELAVASEGLNENLNVETELTDQNNVIPSEQNKGDTGEGESTGEGGESNEGKNKDEITVDKDPVKNQDQALENGGTESVSGSDLTKTNQTENSYNNTDTSTNGSETNTTENKTEANPEAEVNSNLTQTNQAKKSDNINSTGNQSEGDATTPADSTQNGESVTLEEEKDPLENKDRPVVNNDSDKNENNTSNLQTAVQTDSDNNPDNVKTPEVLGKKGDSKLNGTGENENQGESNSELDDNNNTKNLNESRGFSDINNNEQSDDNKGFNELSDNNNSKNVTSNNGQENKVIGFQNLNDNDQLGEKGSFPELNQRNKGFQNLNDNDQLDKKGSFDALDNNDILKNKIILLI